MPRPNSAVLALLSAVQRLSESRPQARLVPSTRATLEAITPVTNFPARWILNNLWLFEPLVLSIAGLDPSADALVRTTTAPTMLTAGVKENVVPAVASGVVNFRILPGDSVASTLEHVRNRVDDPRIEVTQIGLAREPSQASRIDGPAFATLSLTIRKVFPNAHVTPYLVAGGTDARHYRPLSQSVYRFLPIRMTGKERAQLHGTDEHIALDAHLDAVRFYRQLIVELQALENP